MAAYQGLDGARLLQVSRTLSLRLNPPRQLWNSDSFISRDVDATERLLPFQPRFEQTEPDRTVEGCANACADHGYCFAGLENGRECWCGMHEPLNSLRGGFCNAPCSGDFDQLVDQLPEILVHHQKLTNNVEQDLRWSCVVARLQRRL